jgi:hypothetical protein
VVAAAREFAFAGMEARRELRLRLGGERGGSAERVVHDQTLGEHLRGDRPAGEALFDEIAAHLFDRIDEELARHAVDAPLHALPPGFGVQDVHVEIAAGVRRCARARRGHDRAADDDRVGRRQRIGEVDRAAQRLLVARRQLRQPERARSSGAPPRCALRDERFGAAVRAHPRACASAAVAPCSSQVVSAASAIRVKPRAA